MEATLRITAQVNSTKALWTHKKWLQWGHILHITMFLDLINFSATTTFLVLSAVTTLPSTKHCTFCSVNKQFSYRELVFQLSAQVVTDNILPKNLYLDVEKLHVLTWDREASARYQPKLQYQIFTVKCITWHAYLPPSFYQYQIILLRGRLARIARMPQHLGWKSIWLQHKLKSAVLLWQDTRANRMRYMYKWKCFKLLAESSNIYYSTCIINVHNDINHAHS